jgi:hypothetical protein
MSIKQKLFNYLTPVLLGIFMFTSNFINTKIFDFSNNNFAVWFVLSILCFACGWYIGKTLGWHYGGKVIFSTIIAATFLGIIVITFFSDYFNASDLLTENLILYSLRNIVLGSMAFFGMSVVEVFTLQKDLLVNKEKLKIYENTFTDVKKESELELKDAKLKAQQIISDAETKAKDTTSKKDRLEKELKEFIQAEKELIKKYEDKI